MTNKQIADAEKALAAKITKLNAGDKKARKEAAQLGELLGAWRNGRIGDCALINAAK